MPLSLGKMSALLLCVAGDRNPQSYPLALREEYGTGVLASGFAHSSCWYGTSTHYVI